MDITPDGAYLATGNNCGHVFIFSLAKDLEESAKKPRPFAVLKEPKAKGAVTDVAFNPKGVPSVLYATGDVLWRWDYRDPEADKKGENKIITFTEEHED
jgi:hypothetical protein